MSVCGAWNDTAAQERRIHEFYCLVNVMAFGFTQSKVRNISFLQLLQLSSRSKSAMKSNFKFR